MVDSNELRRYLLDMRVFPRDGHKLREYFKMISSRKSPGAYHPPASNRQISRILETRYRPNVYYSLCELVAGFVRKDKYAQMVFYMFKNTNKKDMEYFREIHAHMNTGPGTESIEFQVLLGEHYLQLLRELEPGFSPRNYLDFGCGSGLNTEGVGVAFGLTRANTYGVDIEQEFEAEWNAQRARRNITFKYLGDDGRLPFDTKFDVISAFMVLHHVPPANLMRTLRELRGALRPGGFVIIKEHDCMDSNDAMFIDLEHTLYILKNVTEFSNFVLPDYDNNYLSKHEWDCLFDAAGFVNVYSGYSFLHVRTDIAVNRNYVAVYRCREQKKITK